MWMWSSANQSRSARSERQSRTCCMPRNGATASVMFCNWRSILPTLLVIVVTLPIAKADFLDEIDRKLTFSAFDNFVRCRFSGTLDLENYYVDQPPPGLIF